MDHVFWILIDISPLVVTVAVCAWQDWRQDDQLLARLDALAERHRDAVRCLGNATSQQLGRTASHSPLSTTSDPRDLPK